MNHTHEQETKARSQDARTTEALRARTTEAACYYCARPLSEDEETQGDGACVECFELCALGGAA